MTKYIAHRGHSSLYPENTLLSIKKALIDNYFNGIEIDVRLTKDNKAVVIHDKTINRTSNGAGKVEEMTLKELRQYDYGSWFDRRYKKETIPTLDEVLSLVSGKKDLYIEIKAKKDKKKYIYKIIDKYKYQQNLYIQSFNIDLLNEIKRINKLLKIGLLKVILINNEYNNLDYIGLNYYMNNKDTFSEVEEQYNKILFWTVNNKDDKNKISTEYKNALILTDNSV
jgi:glycerophosphoryl diester phosphodiesterase